jgi:hypothetical protein
VDTFIGVARPDKAHGARVSQVFARERTVVSRADVFQGTLPPRIRRAQANAARSDQVSRVIDGPLLVAALLFLTDQNDLSVRPFPRQFLVNLLEASIRSVDRRLADLEAIGWIRRLPQRYDVKTGQWSISQVEWLPAAIAHLFPPPRPRPDRSAHRAPKVANLSGWGTPTTTKQREAAAPPSPAPTMPTTCQSGPRSVEDDTLGPTPAVLANAPAHTSSQPTPLALTPSMGATLSQHQSPARADPAPAVPGVPRSLCEFVREFDIERRQLAVLLARCRARKQWLQHVVVFAAPHLRRLGLKHSNAVGYLLRMLASDRDFTWALRERERSLRDARRQARRQQLADRIVAAVAPGALLPGLGQVLTRSSACLIVRDVKTRVEYAVEGATVVRVLQRQGWGFIRSLLRGKPVLPLFGQSAQSRPVFPPRVQPCPTSDAAIQERRAPDEFKDLLRNLRRRSLH